VIRDSKNIIPVSMAVLLHAIIFASMIMAFDYARPTPFTPLAVQATLFTEIPDKAPPPPPVDEPEPEPVIEEPEPEPDNSEELRRQAEEEKRRLDALLEQQRLDELKKKEAEDKKRKEREDAERKKREEEEKERKRIEAEKKRQEDVRRQRQENEAKQRQAEIDAEERMLAAANSPAMAVYQNTIMQKIRRNWAMPASVSSDTSCVVMVRQTRTGDVISARIASCNGDDAVKRSIEAAVRKASPLPEPSDPDLFRSDLRITMRPPQ
jgi:colicin import membrane protein